MFIYRNAKHVMSHLRISTPLTPQRMNMTAMFQIFPMTMTFQMMILIRITQMMMMMMIHRIAFIASSLYS